jgi:hypothetical protein
MTKTFSAADVAAHNKPNDLYIVVDEDVYDLTTFQDEHPGTYPLPSCHAQKEEDANVWRTNRREEDPHSRRRQRRLEAILEIPQRIHPQEIQSETTSRFFEYEESRSCARNPSYSPQSRGSETNCGGSGVEA